MKLFYTFFLAVLLPGVLAHTCDRNPCGDRGRCGDVEDVEGEYCCQCQPGFGGTNCQEKQPTAKMCMYCSLKLIPTPENLTSNTICECEDGLKKPTCGAAPVECFYTGSLVYLESGEVIPLSQVVVGHRVLALHPLTGRLAYSPVVEILHHTSNHPVRFDKITTESGHSITLTQNHIIYAADDRSHQLQPRYAGDVKVGEELCVAVGSRHECILSKVVDVEEVVREGAISPLTTSGSIVVDEVLASCYVHTVWDVVAHSSMAPLRLAAAHTPAHLTRIYPTLLTAASKILLPGTAFYQNTALTLS